MLQPTPVNQFPILPLKAFLCSNDTASKVGALVLLAWLVGPAGHNLFAQNAPAAAAGQDTSIAPTHQYDFSAPVGPHHRIVDTVVNSQDADGNPIQVPSHYTEVAT